ncbi:MAG: LLM class F420-dependent oxidoreductase [Actinomycetota bacterium]|nr:LLM class F420-dependent oxidoreductase [Actinomycetota bacterium]
MHVGIVPINSGYYIEPRFITRFAPLIESLGYESVWTFEHVIVPEAYQSTYPYNPSGKLALAGGDRFVDPLIALSWVAACTERLRLGTGVNILSQTNPLYLAKQASSIDHLSGGRLMLGLGVGWLKEEFDALGVPFDDRGARADEYLDAMTQAWSGEPVDYRGRFVDWHGFRMLPRSTQRPRVPVVIGGTSPAAIRRVVARGDGWYVIHRDLEHFHSLMAALRAEGDQQGRDIGELEITAYWNYHREGLDGARAYAEAGVHRLLVNLQALRMGQPEEAVKRFADEALAHLG